MITIRINSAEVLYDIKSKSHTEVTVAVPDESQRYRIEAGTEKEDEIKRCIEQAFAEASGMLARWLIGEYTDDGDITTYKNQAVSLPDYLVFYFDWSERRYREKHATLTTLLFSLIVNLAMERFYLSVQAEALAKVRAGQAQSDMSQIQSLVYYKGAPKIEHVTEE